jgi:hypothetical protein
LINDCPEDEVKSTMSDLMKKEEAITQADTIIAKEEEQLKKA